MPDFRYEPDNKTFPVAIGGVGGSGTRLIASVLRQLGYDLGSDLNEAHDNLAYTLLLKRSDLWPIEDHDEEIRKATTIFLKGMRGRLPFSVDEIAYIYSLTAEDRLQQHLPDWLVTRANNLILGPRESTGQSVLWGWKEPNTHIALPVISHMLPTMRYIHVMRHGLDMAHSRNQNQLRFWGNGLLNETDLDANPSNSFRYWCAAHRRVLAIGRSMGSRFFLLNYDKFCADPESGLSALLAFLGIARDSIDKKTLIGSIKPSSSIGRFRREQPIEMAPDDKRLLIDLGYYF